MSDSERPEWESGDQRPGERVIDVSGQEPVIVEEQSRAPSFTGGTDWVRVHVASSGARGCVIPLALILLLLCCSCIVFWSLTDNLF